MSKRVNQETLTNSISNLANKIDKNFVKETNVYKLFSMPLEKTIVCIVDDDGTTRTNDSYTGMLSWLNNQGIPMNFAICYDTVGTGGKYTITQLQELQNSGNGILIHGSKRLQDFNTIDDVRTELETALQFHKDNNFNIINAYVYPNGANDDTNLTAKEVRKVVGEYFDYGLSINVLETIDYTQTKGMWNKVPLEDKLNVGRMEIAADKGFNQRKSFINDCIVNKGLLILFTHSFQSQFLTGGGYTEFQNIINYLLTQDVEFMTIGEALAVIEKSNMGNYNSNENLPSINDVELKGDLTSEDLKLVNNNAIKNSILDEIDYLNMSANEFVNLLGAGWNLGNSLDSWDSVTHDPALTPEEWETSWHNPITTKEMIQMVADAGFKTIRIPVTYRVHFEDDGKTIKEEWFERVEEVINYAFDCGLYVITNVHHDTGTDGILNADLANIDSMKEYLTNLWDQIGTRFAKYSYRLIFEGFNEMLNPTLSDAWKGDEDAYEAVNILNQTFVNVVRKQKGNENRFLICNTYGAQCKDYHCSAFKLPHDIVNNKIIVEVHNYNKTDDTIAELFTTLEHYFVSKNIPIIIGEFGTKSIDKDSTNGLTLDEREVITDLYVSRARKLGIPVVVWDNNNGSYQLLDREDLEWKYPTLVNEIINLTDIYRKIDYNYLDENFNLYDSDNYRKGHYGYADGLYTPSTSGSKTEISSMYYLKPKYKTYTASTTNSNFRIQVMQLDKELNFIKADTVVNGSFSIESDTSYIAITIYMKDVAYTIEEMVNEIESANMTIVGSNQLNYLNYCSNNNINTLDISTLFNNIELLNKYMIPYVVLSGSGNAFTGTISNITEYSDGLALCIKLPEDTTDICTIDINGLGAIEIKDSNSLKANIPYNIRYEITANCFYVM